LDNYVIAYADKTVLKIHGISVKGLDAGALEKLLSEKLQSVVRVIGVTGDSIAMDLYGVDEESILKDEAGIIHTVSLTNGITVSDVTEISYAKKIVPVNFDEIPELKGCAKQRWAENDDN
jgi:hypothetical protein